MNLVRLLTRVLDICRKQKEDLPGVPIQIGEYKQVGLVALGWVGNLLQLATEVS